MLALSPDFDDALDEARCLLSPGRILVLYNRIRAEFPNLPRDAPLADMTTVVMALGVMQTACTQVKVAV